MTKKYGENKIKKNPFEREREREREREVVMLGWAVDT